MYRKTVFVTGLLMLSLFCGCLSGVPGSSTPADTSCGSILNIEQVDTDDINTADWIVNYANLSNRQKLNFRRALGSGSVDIGEHYSDIWTSADIIRYNSSAYEPTVVVC